MPRLLSLTLCGTLLACSQIPGQGSSNGTSSASAGTGAGTTGATSCPGGCLASQICYQGQCQAISCQQTGHCPNGLVCSSGVCIDTSCQPPCSTGQVCQSKVCVQQGSTGNGGGGSSGGRGSTGASGTSGAGVRGTNGASSSAASSTGTGSSGGGSTSGGANGGTTGAVGCATTCQAQSTCQNGACVCPGSYQYVNDLCVYCDGFACDDPSQNQILVDTAVFYSALLGGGCLAELQADGGSYATVGGIWDTDIDDDGSATPVEAIFPGGCDDMGLGAYGGVGDGGLNFTAPGGALSVATAVATQGTGMSVYGVVTALYGWKLTPATSGLVYLQDPVASGTAPPASGVAVYAKDTFVASLGASVPPRGSVVEFTGLDWEPFLGQSQLVTTSGSTVTILGNARLPAPVPLPASELGPTGATASNPYKGMRVVSQSASCQTVDACPLDLEFLHP